MITPEEKVALLTQIEELAKLQQKTSAGPWENGHLGNNNTTCECTYVLGPQYCGSICDVSVDNGLHVGQGGNDAPPREEAIANMHFITKSRNFDFVALCELLGLELPENISEPRVTNQGPESIL